MSIEGDQYLRETAKEGMRLDDRKPLERRAITLNTHVINHSDGSSSVEIGKTRVIAGVKVLPAEPFPDKPNDGALIVNFEASDLASGYPIDRILYSVEVGRVTDRGIRESQLIDTKKLCIEPGKKVLFVYVDVFTINNDGNLLDTANMAALAALLDAKYKPNENSEPVPVPLNKANIAISSTFVKIGDTIFMDPNRLEEDAADARLTVGVGDGINSLQKGGSGFFTLDEVMQCVDNAFIAKSDILKMLKV
jgi:exosome complex component RRP42